MSLVKSDINTLSLGKNMFCNQQMIANTMNCIEFVLPILQLLYSKKLLCYPLFLLKYHCSFYFGFGFEDRVFCVALHVLKLPL